MTTVEKKSFFERLTGAQHLDDSEPMRSSLPIYEEEETTQFTIHTNDEPAAQIVQPTVQPSWSAPS